MGYPHVGKKKLTRNKSGQDHAVKITPRTFDRSARDFSSDEKSESATAFSIIEFANRVFADSSHNQGE